MEKKYSIGSLFAGIGGFELGLERAIPGAYTLWQVEQEKYCKKVLSKHWPEATIYDDVRNITKNNTKQVDILCGGFPCQDISVAGKGEGLHGKKSGLWWEMHRIIEELQPKAVIMENVAAITIRGLGTVLGSLSQIGYDAEWCTIRASDFGAPHKRSRWFCIAYPRTIGNYLSNEKNFSTYSNNLSRLQTDKTVNPIRESRYSWEEPTCSDRREDATYSDGSCRKQSPHTISMEQEIRSKRTICEGFRDNERRSYWQSFPTESPVCRRDDGIPYRVDRLRALGNAIVPQCSEWIGRKLWESGILQSSN